MKVRKILCLIFTVFILLSLIGCKNEIQPRIISEDNINTEIENTTENIEETTVDETMNDEDYDKRTIMERMNVIKECNVYYYPDKNIGAVATTLYPGDSILVIKSYASNDEFYVVELDNGYDRYFVLKECLNIQNN